MGEFEVVCAALRDQDKRNENEDEEEDSEEESDEEEVEEDSSDVELSEEDEDIEQNDNKVLRPFRDSKVKDIDNVSDTEINQPNVTIIKRRELTEKDIRERVRKTISKQQKERQRRNVKKGEASVTT